MLGVSVVYIKPYTWWSWRTFAYLKRPLWTFLVANDYNFLKTQKVEIESVDLEVGYFI
jgi:hypothetical protein